MDSTKVKAIICAVLALFAALYLGITAATAQFETIAWVVGGVGLSTCLLLGRRIWLLIPFLGSLHLILMVPGTPSTLQVAEILVVGFSIMMLLLRRLPFRFRFTEIEWWILLLLLFVAQVYVRNPAGLGILGGNTIGGRAYANFAIALLAALVLCGLLVPPSELRSALKLSILGGILNFAIGVVGLFSPLVGQLTGMAERGDNSSNEAVDTSQAGRVHFLVVLPKTLANWVASYRNPIRACFSLRWAPLLILSLGFAAISGFRNVVAAIGMTYLVGLFYRGGLIQLFVAGLMGALAVAGLAAFNLISPLPPNIQRALSVFPGTWDDRYVLDAESSTRWRVEMWEEVLTTDRWIQNKTFGDGLGFSARELELQAQINATGQSNWKGVSGLDLAREYVLINGDYHSGPVSAVRTIGYVGLAVMLAFQVRLLVHAHRQILRCRGTEWFPIALYFCIPIVWFPFFFTFIYGGFKGDVVAILLNAGMLRMLENNLPLPPYVSAARRSIAPPLRSNRNVASPG